MHRGGKFLAIAAGTNAEKAARRMVGIKAEVLAGHAHIQGLYLLVAQVILRPAFGFGRQRRIIK